MTVTQTLAPHLRGEDALAYLPDRDGQAGEVMIFGEPLESIDACGGAALRSAVEYHCRFLQRRMTVSLPRLPEAAALLHGLLRRDHPAHLVLPHDSEEQRAPLPPSVLLQAVPVADRNAAEIAAAEICEAGEEIGVAARFLAMSLPELAQNSHEHAPGHPLPPVACALHDAPAGELQLAVVDLGQSRPAFTEETLRDAVESGGHCGGLASLGAQAAERGLGLTVEVAAGEGRLASTPDGWGSRSGPRLQGFCVTLRIQTGSLSAI